MHISGQQLEAEARQKADEDKRGVRRFINLAAKKRKETRRKLARGEG